MLPTDKPGYSSITLETDLFPQQGENKATALRVAVEMLALPRRPTAVEAFLVRDVNIFCMLGPDPREASIYIRAHNSPPPRDKVDT